jgi:hypothetical protein
MTQRVEAARHDQSGNPTSWPWGSVGFYAQEQHLGRESDGCDSRRLKPCIQFETRFHGDGHPALHTRLQIEAHRPNTHGEPSVQDAKRSKDSMVC